MSLPVLSVRWKHNTKSVLWWDSANFFDHTSRKCTAELTLVSEATAAIENSTQLDEVGSTCRNVNSTS